MPKSDERPISINAAEADRIDFLVNSGVYPSAAEVIREALHALEERNGAIERWLREEVVPVYDEMEVHPERALSAEQVFDALRAHHAERIKTK